MHNLYTPTTNTTSNMSTESKIVEKTSDNCSRLQEKLPLPVCPPLSDRL